MTKGQAMWYELLNELVVLASIAGMAVGYIVLVFSLCQVAAWLETRGRV